MNTQLKRGVSYEIGWIFIRLILLNIIIIFVAYLIGTARNIFESVEPFVVRLPFQQFVTTVFLTNLIYIIGLLFESIYLRWWNKKIALKEMEKKFFKAALIMIGIVNTTYIIIYLIGYFS